MSFFNMIYKFLDIKPPTFGYQPVDDLDTSNPPSGKFKCPNIIPVYKYIVPKKLPVYHSYISFDYRKDAFGFALFSMGDNFKYGSIKFCKRAISDFGIDSTEDCIFIHDLEVFEHNRQSGIGTYLLNEAILYGIRKLKISLNISNVFKHDDTSLAFFKKNGFQEHLLLHNGQKKNYNEGFYYVMVRKNEI